ncbi:MAG: hypothetical protein PVH73_08975, partial [Candidatus Bathyarchaeota archaeon]
MQNTKTLEPLLNKAKEHEKRYDWLGAANIYKKASGLASKEDDSLRASDLLERMGFCYSRAALQAETNESFRNRMKLAAKVYEHMVELFEKAKEEEKGANINHSKALVAYANSWLATNQPKKDTLLDEWWDLEKKTLKAHEEAGDLQAIGKTCNDLMQGSHVTRIWVLTQSERQKRYEELISLGERGIAALSEADDNYELARAYCWTGWTYSLAVIYAESEAKGELGQKGWSYSKKALELSEKIGDANLIGWSNNVASLVAMTYNPDINLALEFNEKTRKQSATTKDNIMMAVGGMWAGAVILNFQEEDPNKQRERLEKAVKWTEDSIYHYKIVGKPRPISVSYRLNVGNLTELASIETNLDAKRALLKKAIKTARELVEYSKEWATEKWSPFEALSRALYRLSETETKNLEKRRLLEEASVYSEKRILAGQKHHPFVYWARTRDQNDHALILAELAKIETDKQKKIEFLNDAVSSMENCLKLMAKDDKEHSTRWKSGLYGRYYYWFGEILAQLYAQTKEQKTLNRAIEVYTCTTEIFSKADLMTHAAESQWQTAKLHNQLGKHLKASHNYESAAQNYKLAAEKIPQLKDFYTKHSLYMQAWSQIEQARHFHSIEDYIKSQDQYEKAAKLHESAEPWSYLAPNYFAWAKVEEAENLSRNENTQQAKQVFQKAYEQFGKAEEYIKQKMAEITSADEKEMTQRLFKASDLRRKYCQARILLEEAKLLDREGKYLQSSKSYGEAAQKIAAIIEKIDAEAERRELEYIAILCQAW